MKRRTKHRSQRESLCAEFHEDDGIDPRLFFRSKDRVQENEHKARQLCKQVFHRLALVIGGDCGDPILHEIEIVSVVPAPDTSRLLVTVQISPSARGVTSDHVSARLQAAQAFLRQEVAAAICRKRIPELAFAVVPRSQVRS